MGTSNSASLPLVHNLLLESLCRNLGLKQSTQALLPRLFQRLDLAAHTVLLRPPSHIRLLLLLLQAGQLSLDVLQDVLKLRVAYQPRVLAKLLQQAELGQSALDVLGAGVRLLQGLAPSLEQLGTLLISRRSRILRRVEIFVALQVYARELGGGVVVEARMLARDEVGKSWCVYGGGWYKGGMHF